MIIHVVTAGDTISMLSERYGVNPDNLMADNGLRMGETLVIGQALVVAIPEQLHVVQEGESLSQIAEQYGTTVRQLYRNNFSLGGLPALQVGQQLVIRYQGQGEKGSFVTNSYAYPYIEPALLRPQLPYLTYFAPFTYGISFSGGLVDLDDAQLIALAEEYGTKPLMHLSTLTEEGGFSNARASLVFNDEAIQENIINEILLLMQNKGYQGLDVDFEFIYPEERYDYITFLQNLRIRLNEQGMPLFSALAPKTSDTQSGVLYEGHDYAGIGAAANAVLLMTYEWGYTFGPRDVKYCTIRKPSNHAGLRESKK